MHNALLQYTQYVQGLRRGMLPLTKVGLPWQSRCKWGSPQLRSSCLHTLDGMTFCGTACKVVQRLPEVSEQLGVDQLTSSIPQTFCYEL